jgi:hypothetical protein
MKNIIGGLSVELDVDVIMIRDAKTSQLIKAKSVDANNAVETYIDLVKVLKEKHLQKTEQA